MRNTETKGEMTPKGTEKSREKKAEARERERGMEKEGRTENRWSKAGEGRMPTGSLGRERPAEAMAVSPDPSVAWGSLPFLPCAHQDPLASGKPPLSSLASQKVTSIQLSGQCQLLSWVEEACLGSEALWWHSQTGTHSSHLPLQEQWLLGCFSRKPLSPAVDCKSGDLLSAS